MKTSLIKKHILFTSLLLLPLSSACAALMYNNDGNKVDLYGRVTAKRLFSKEPGLNTDASYVRLGFRGETEINDNLTGYGHWEYQYQADNDEEHSNVGNKTRLAFAGFKFANLATFDYGRNFGVLFDAESYTDMLPDFGGDTMAYPDNFLTSRTTGVATLRGLDFFSYVKGLNVALQYQGKNDKTSRDEKGQNGEGYGLSASYNNIAGSAVSLAAAYAHSRRTEGQENLPYGSGRYAEAWAASIKYDDGEFYLAATGNSSRNMVPIQVAGVKGLANKAAGYELVAQYQFKNGFRPTLGYVFSKAYDLESIGSRYLKNYFSVGATHYFNENIYANIIYKINQINDDKAVRDSKFDAVSASINYKF